MILDQLGMLAIEATGFLRVFVAQPYDDDSVHPWGLFIQCHGEESEAIQLGDYVELEDAQQALKAVYAALANGVSVSLEGKGLEVENS